MPKIVGHAVRVVDVDGVLTIDEYCGNVGSNSPRISIAVVKVSATTSEPWLTLRYDEWICVIKGRIILEFADGQIEVKAGETAFIEAGERFHPVFPEGDTEYVPVCLPAFRPDLCIREDGPDSKVSERLNQLHAHALLPPPPPNPADIIYHMCLKESWEAAKLLGGAYFPSTFEKDGWFTHATAVPSRLVETANHFYQASVGDWICLRISRTALYHRGIIVRDEQPLPVGEQAVGEAWQTWVCPHIYGGIPTVGVVDYVYPMTRDSVGRFTGILGLVD